MTAKKPRKKKAASQSAAYLPREQELADKYPHQAIIAGSWRQAGHPDRPGWASKVTVEISCKACEKPRVLATSDLQWRTTCYCVVCAKDVKKNARKTKEEKKSQ